jgi:coenzyme F420-reducing hydrogenase alpha subunit
VSDLAGQIEIELSSGDGAPRVRIQSSRPVSASRVFAGKPVAVVAGQLPLLYSVCGTAQATACVRALEAALGLAPAPSAQAARSLLLLAETAKEHLWRLLLDWPKALAPLGIDLPSLPSGSVAGGEAAVAAVMRAFLTLRASLATAGDPFKPGAGPLATAPAHLEAAGTDLVATVADWVFGSEPAHWLAETRTRADLARWAEHAGTPVAALLLAVQAGGLADLGRCAVGTLAVEHAGGALDEGVLRRLAAALGGTDADAFVAAPELDGRAAESTPFSRELARGELVTDLATDHGNGLLPRLAALLTELARDCAQLAGAARGDAAVPPLGASLAVEPGIGVGAAPAARGLLIHRIALGAGASPASARVREYRIAAPTEWNFHPRGVVATALTGLVRDPPAEDASLEARARLVVTAVDPCVDYRLALRRA